MAAARRPSSASVARPTLELVAVEVENLRNYGRARLSIRPLTVIVGDNNQGKSSILKLADWLFNRADLRLFEDRRALDQDELDFLMPATQTQKKARRLTVWVNFKDGRRGRPFGQTEREPARLRLTIQKTKRSARVNTGPPRTSETRSSERGIELLKKLRESVTFRLVPSVRDQRQEEFETGLQERLGGLLERFQHDRAAGAPTEYRVALRFLNWLKKALTGAETDLNDLLRTWLPAGLLRTARLGLNADPADLAAWLRGRIELELCTGDHDSNFVLPHEVGNGLQSAIQIALALPLKTKKPRDQVIIALEEPEAFLHPSAQRWVGTMLRHLADDPRRRIVVTTHSPYVVDEARYGETVLVRSHEFFEPAVVETARAAISSSLMDTRSAEAFFSAGLLLVEGPGDVAFFDTLLRRARHISGLPELSKLTVLDVGGKRRFAPWWNLLRSYGRDGHRPIEWISLFDGDGASNDGGERAAFRAMQDAGLTPTAELRDSLISFGDRDWLDVATRKVACGALNRESEKLGVIFFSVDCEWATFGHLAERSPDLVAQILGCDVPSGDPVTSLAKIAGSKVRDGSSAKGAKKAPHFRRALAEGVDFAGLSDEVKAVLKRWFSLVMPETQALSIIQ